MKNGFYLGVKMRSTTRLNWMRFYIQSWRRRNVESRASVTLPHLECDRPMRGLEWRTLTNQRLVCPGQCHARWTGLILSNCNTLVTVRQSGYHRPMRGLKRKRLTNQRPCSTRNSEAMQWPGAVTRIAQWEGIKCHNSGDHSIMCHQTPPPLISLSHLPSQNTVKL